MRSDVPGPAGEASCVAGAAVLPAAGAASLRLSPAIGNARRNLGMFRVFQNRRSAALLLEMLLDIALGFAALLVAAAMVENWSPANWRAALAGKGLLLNAAGFAVVLALWQYLLGVYHGSARGFAGQATRLVAAVVVGGYLSYLALKAQGPSGHPSRLVVYAVLNLLLAMFMVRGLIVGLRALAGTAKVLIVGTASEAQVVVGDLALLDGPLPREVVGFFPTSTDGPDGDGIDVRRLDTRVPLVQHVHALNVSEIIVAAREQRGGVVPMDQLLLCRSIGIPVIDSAGFYERTHGEVPLESLKASWLVYGPGFVQGRARRALKRAFDIVISLALLIGAAPVMLLAALAIRLDSRGPIIYRQERVGLNGAPFTCLKFRSMGTDAERDGVAKWASRDDPRVTRVGRFLRQTRIDELPQLLSVLKSEMSLVGPRPERPGFVQHLSQQVPFYDLRHTVKPGVTGWAQVRYAYGASLDDARRKHQFDLYYVKNNSLLLDVLILLETIGVVLQREGQ